MAIVDHVWCHEDPLRDSSGVNVRGEVVEVADPSTTRVDGGDGIEYDGTIVLAHVIGVWWRRGVDIVGRGKAIRG